MVRTAMTVAAVRSVLLLPLGAPAASRLRSGMYYQWGSIYLVNRQQLAVGMYQQAKSMPEQR